jgi:hypothetical protein
MHQSGRTCFDKLSRRLDLAELSATRRLILSLSKDEADQHDTAGARA